jgi:hypothetical protein
MRRCRRVLILFIAAAMLNVLVAWGCILWSPYTSHTAPSDESLADGYPASIAGPYGQQGYWFAATGFGAWQSVPSGARGAEGQFISWRGTHTPAYYRGGWPMWSLQSTVTFHDYRARWDLPVTEILRRGMQTSWLPAWLHVHQERRLPLVPFWSGFAANTLVYLLVIVAIRLLVIRVFKWTSGRAATTPPAQSGRLMAAEAARRSARRDGSQREPFHRVEPYQLSLWMRPPFQDGTPSLTRPPPDALLRLQQAE